MISLSEAKITVDGKNVNPSQAVRRLLKNAPTYRPGICGVQP
jgi:hypothetical protein